jgi:hypothetical protein
MATNPAAGVSEWNRVAPRALMLFSLVRRLSGSGPEPFA